MAFARTPKLHVHSAAVVGCMSVAFATVNFTCNLHAPTCNPMQSKLQGSCTDLMCKLSHENIQHHMVYDI